MIARTQKIISASLVAIVVMGSFYALVQILNLNQTALFIKTAIVVWAYIWFKIAFLYDLHFKQRNVVHQSREEHSFLPAGMYKILRIVASAFFERFKHLIIWKYYSQALNYLLLPGFLFWGTVMVLYAHFGQVRTQFTVAIFSTIALTVSFYYIKEAFARKTERVDKDIFIALSVVKIYAITVVFGGTMALMRSFCLDPQLFLITIFCVSFLFVYQALYQHRMLNIRNTGIALIMSACCGIVGYCMYIYWGYNFFTAAIFFGAIYNFLWGVFHYYLDQSLNRKVFLEILLFCFIIAAMVFSATNFKARLLDDCPATWQL